METLDEETRNTESYATQLQDRKYINWVKGGLALKFLKDGISDFADEVAKSEHIKMLQDIGLSPGSSCNMCTLKTLKPQHASLQQHNHCPIGQRNCNCLLSNTVSCPNDICGRIYDEIVKSHTMSGPNWKNTDITKWTTHPWEIAKCFINMPGYAANGSAEETDIAGLLQLTNYSTFFQRRFIHVYAGQFNQIREWRNMLFHSPSMELEDQQLTDGIKDMITLLEEEHDLKARQRSKEAVLNLKTLQQGKLIITTETEAEVCRSALEFITQKSNELKYMQEIAKNDIEEIKKCMAFQHEEALKKDSETATKSNAELQSELSELRKLYSKAIMRVEDLEADVAILKNTYDHQTEQLENIKKTRKHYLVLKKNYRQPKGPKQPMIVNNYYGTVNNVNVTYNSGEIRTPNVKEDKKTGNKKAIQRGQCGNFIDTRDAPLLLFMNDIIHLAKAAKWVCQICISLNDREKTTGTGFRVGSKYIMTAYHVVKPILDKELQNV